MHHLHDSLPALLISVGRRCCVETVIHTKIVPFCSSLYPLLFRVHRPFHVYIITHNPATLQAPVFSEFILVFQQIRTHTFSHTRFHIHIHKNSHRRMSWQTSPLVVLSMCAAVSANGGRPDWDYDFSIVEGDIQVPIETDRAGNVLGATPLSRASQLFPVGEAVNYYIASPLRSSDSRVASAVRDWESKTCFRFNQCSSDSSCPRPYIRFQNGNGCSSPVGRRGTGVNSVSIANGCGVGATIHEIGHSLGLSHEQSRKDRDEFVRVDLSQVTRGMEHNFDKNRASGRDLGKYDYGSIMHYGPNGFRIGRQPTIISPQPIGQRSGLSAGDVAGIEFMYNKCSTRFTAPRCIASQSESTTLVIPVGEDFSVDFNALYTASRSMRVTYPNTNAPDTQFVTRSGTTITDTGYAALRYTPTRNDAGRTFVLAATFTASDGPASECRVNVRVEGGGGGPSPPSPPRTRSPPRTSSPPPPVWTRPPRPAPSPSSCRWPVQKWGSCRFSPDCCVSGTTCFEVTSRYAECMPSCSPRRGKSCRVLGGGAPTAPGPAPRTASPPVRTPAPRTAPPSPSSCRWPVQKWGSCLFSPDCCESGTTCFEVTSRYAECMPSCSQRRGKSCRVLGGGAPTGPAPAPRTRPPPPPPQCRYRLREYSSCMGRESCCSWGLSCVGNRWWKSCRR